MQQSREPVDQPGSGGAGQRLYPELSQRTILWWGVGLLATAGSLVAILLIAFGGQEHSPQLDAIKTAGTVVLGTGGAAALWLSARRQRTAEIALNQQREANIDAKYDAAERRLTELYVKAVEQLGSNKAAVRHGGLYALERVAQDNPSQRQTVVDVVCAYLRAPWIQPVESSTLRLGVRRPLLPSGQRRAAARSSMPGIRSAFPPRKDVNDEARQEREVRLTAQRLLRRHLVPGNDTDAPVHTFWAGISLDLTGAALIDFDLSRCYLDKATFAGASFSGSATFRKTVFAGDAVFDSARFSGASEFDWVRFVSEAIAENVKFVGHTSFHEVRFTGGAMFKSAVFADGATFELAKFNDGATFELAVFAKRTIFSRADFDGYVTFFEAAIADSMFDLVRFLRGGSFDKAVFIENVSFYGARFANITFQLASFMGVTIFDGASFTGFASFEQALFDGNVTFDGGMFAEFTTFAEVTFTGEVPAEVAAHLASDHEMTTANGEAQDEPNDIKGNNL